MRSYRAFRILAKLCWCIFTIVAGLAWSAASAQPSAPSLINPRLRLDGAPVRPGVLRFLTADDNPPFHFAAPDGTLAGYDIDLARAICGELKIACTIQARRAELLPDALASGAGDALIPAPAGRSDDRFALSLPYLPRPGRFAWRRGAPPLAEATVAALAGRTVGVVAQSPHAAFLARFFPGVRTQVFDSRAALFDSLGHGGVELVFADGADLAFWLNGVAADGCCAFVPGAFLDPALFGPGMTIAVRAADDDLRRAFDTVLARLDGQGVLTELYLRYFPVPLF